MRVHKIRYCNEDFISRIPALFAYIEYDDYGNAVLHKATDSDNGCYGKYVENIMYNGEPVSFRTLYIRYYEHKKKDEKNELTDFFENGIGKMETNMDGFEPDQDLVPSFVYLATAARMYNEYLDVKRICDYFEANKESIKEKSDYERLCCVCQKYYRMGGDEMLGILEGYVEEAKTRAEKLYNDVKDLEENERCSYNISVFLPNTINDMGIMSDYIDEWVAGAEYKKGEVIFHEGKTMICIVEVSTGKYDEELERIVFPEDDFKDITEGENELMSSDNHLGIKYIEEPYQLKGYSDSKLRSLRRFQDYTNEYDKVVDSGISEDWLYFYRIGVVHYNMENDEFGNILTVNYDTEYDGGKGDEIKNLLLYGSGIESIEADADNRTITFTYYENAHLSCTLQDIETDDDGNDICTFSDFKVDKDGEHGKYHGVWYKDVYTYKEGSDLDTLVKGGGLADYVSVDNNSIDRTKYEFTTYGSLVYRDRMVGTEKYRTCHIVSEFETNVNNDISESYAYNPLMKTDYFMGITYQPVRDIEVNVLRGNNAAFERHLKLGEVKSLADLETYSNGGFYRIVES